MKNLPILLFVIYLLSSCSPKFFIKSNIKIDNLKIAATFNSRITPEDKEKLNMEINHTIDKWNIENHKFKLSLVDTSVTKANLLINIDSIYLPSRFIELDAVFINLGVWFTAGYLISQYNNPFFILFGLVSIQLNDITVIQYKINDYSDKQLESVTRFTSKTILFKNKIQERNRHLRNFDSQLFDFIEKFEKEYKKKNGL